MYSTAALWLKPHIHNVISMQISSWRNRDAPGIAMVSTENWLRYRTDIILSGRQII